MNSFGGIKKLWIFLGDHYITGLIGGGGGGGGERFFFIHFRPFLRQGTEWESFFCGHKISNIYLEMPDMRDIFNG